MRDMSKLIMFDFGGVVETGVSKDRYSYKTIFVDAIRYATGMKVPAGVTMEEDDNRLWDAFKAYPSNRVLCTSCRYKSALYNELGILLCRISGRPEEDGIAMAKDFCRYVRGRYCFQPFRKDMVKLQVELKEKCLVGGITNNSLIWSDRFHEVTDVIGYDFCYESFMHGFIKPYTPAYKTVESFTGLHGYQILLVDDTYENVKSAIDFGWCAYHVESLDDDTYNKVKAVANQFLSNDADAWPFLTSYK